MIQEFPTSRRARRRPCIRAHGAAFAHPGGAQAHGLIAGLAHPISGVDHLAAMAAVGVIAAQAWRARPPARPRELC